MQILVVQTCPCATGFLRQLRRRGLRAAVDVVQHGAQRRAAALRELRVRGCAAAPCSKALLCSGRRRGRPAGHVRELHAPRRCLAEQKTLQPLTCLQLVCFDGDGHTWRCDLQYPKSQPCTAATEASICMADGASYGGCAMMSRCWAASPVPWQRRYEFRQACRKAGLSFREAERGAQQVCSIWIKSSRMPGLHLRGVRRDQGQAPAARVPEAPPWGRRTVDMRCRSRISRASRRAFDRSCRLLAEPSWSEPSRFWEARAASGRERLRALFQFYSTAKLAS